MHGFWLPLLGLLLASGGGLDQTRVKLSSGCFSSCDIGCTLTEVEASLTSVDASCPSNRGFSPMHSLTPGASGTPMSDGSTGVVSSCSNSIAAFDVTPQVADQWAMAWAKGAQDLNGDQILDIVFGVYATGGSSDTIIYLLNGNGDGNFQAPKLIHKALNSLEATGFAIPTRRGTRRRGGGGGHSPARLRCSTNARTNAVDGAACSSANVPC